MKFNVGGKAMLQELSAISKVINSKNSISILDNFLFNLDGETLSITGSDSENFVTSTLQVTEPEGSGAICVPAKKLLEVLKEVPGQALTFYINEETKEIDIKFLNGHFNFIGADGREYPVPGEPEADARTFSLPASVIVSGIDNTLFAVSTDTLRPQMTGIFWDIKPDSIVFVSSDTHKLVRNINTLVAPGFETSFIMPAKPAAILRSLLDKSEGEASMTLDSKTATFSFDNYRLSCRFINGRFPDYNRVIPTSNPFDLTVDRESLLNAMRRVALCASMASNLVRINIQADEMLLSSQDVDYATSAEERIQCDYKGNAMTIGFAAPYMIEELANLRGDTIIIKLSDPARPAIFLPEVQDEGSEVIMLLMPMQVLDY